MEYETLKLKTCAGIVLYNPEIDKLKNNIDSLIEQVNEIVLIDNNSDNRQEIVKLISGYSKRITSIINDKNLGIAAALNQILEYAKNNNYDWYISMDQDSCCSKNLISAYAKAIENEESVGILCPYVLNNGKESLEEYSKRSLPSVSIITEPIDCITSGCLNNTKAAENISGYEENLFIDCVDVEFNIRMMRCGYKILKVNNAYLIQFMGEKRSVPIIQLLYKLTHKNIFKRLRFTPVYSTFRLYYIARNSRYVWLKYGKISGQKMSPSWIFFQFVYYFVTYPLSYNRIKMIKTYINAIKDSNMMVI